MPGFLMTSAEGLKSRLVPIVLCLLLLVSPEAAGRVSRPTILPGKSNVYQGLDMIWPVNLTTVSTAAHSYLPMCKAKGSYNDGQLVWVRSDNSASPETAVERICPPVKNGNGESQIHFPIGNITQKNMKPQFYKCEANGTESSKTFKLTVFSPPTNVVLTFVGPITNSLLSVYQCCADNTYPPVGIYWKVYSPERGWEMVDSSPQAIQSEENNRLCKSVIAQESAGGLVVCNVKIDSSHGSKMCTAPTDATKVHGLCEAYFKQEVSRNMSLQFRQENPIQDPPTTARSKLDNVSPSSHRHTTAAVLTKEKEKQKGFLCCYLLPFLLPGNVVAVYYWRKKQKPGKLD